MASDPGIRDQAVPARCVPCLRVFADTLFVDDGSRQGDEVQTAMLRLEFEYAGVGGARGARVRAGEPWRALQGRDREAESQACRVLEGFGAIELSHLDDCAVSPGTGADYVVAVDGDVHALCAFSAYAVPQLRGLGWRVDIAPEFPWQVVATDAPLYAAAFPDGERPDWFALELGVELDGHRVDLLPALLELLDGTGDLSSLVRPARRCVAVRVDDRHWLPVPPARLRLLAKVLLELYRSGGGKIRAPAVRAPVIAELCATLHDGTRPLRWVGDRRIREQAYALALGPRRTQSSSRRRNIWRLCSTISARNASRTSPNRCACSASPWRVRRRSPR